MIIGCVFTLILIAFLFYFCRNVTVTVRIEYPEVKYEQIEDLYDEDGEIRKVEKHEYDLDSFLKEVNDLMLDREESDG